MFKMIRRALKKSVTRLPFMSQLKAFEAFWAFIIEQVLGQKYTIGGTTGLKRPTQGLY